MVISRSRTRFKTVDGVIEQMAGMAFRVQDEKNFYVVRASSLGNKFRFYKVVNGQRGTIIGANMKMPKGVWHELSVGHARATRSTVLLDGKAAIPTLTDNDSPRARSPIGPSRIQ